MRFCIYYHLESCGEYVSTRQGRRQNDLHGLLELLQRLRIPEDEISLREVASAKKIRFYLDQAEKGVFFELDDPNLALTFTKLYRTDEWALRALVSDVEKALRCDPESLGFSCQSF